jgi:polar amino acid transport system substrate-binding protein
VSWVKKVWLFLFVLFSLGAKSEELVLVAGLAKPPYVIPEQNAGFEIELMRGVLATLGCEILVLYVPYGRTYETMQQVQADIGLTLSERSGVENGILSLPYVTYQNVAVSLLEKSIKLDRLEELQGFTVVAFQNANKVLGSAFAAAVKKSPLYIELPEQRRQVELLLSGKVEVAVMDINIFKYFAMSISGTSQLGKMKVHSLFPSIQYRAAISDPVLRKAFNQALSEYVNSAEYGKLLAKYDMASLPQD